MWNKKIKWFLGLALLSLIIIVSCVKEITKEVEVPGPPGRDGIAGQDGNDGVSVVIRMGEATAEQCSNGGTVIIFAFDTNFNGEYDETDTIINEVPICNGADGVNCWDLNQNGQGDASEDINEDGVVDVNDCQAGDVIYNVISIPKDSNECGGNGGWAVSFGVDDNQNNELDTDEIRETFNVCNGADGNDGVDGLNGIGVVTNTEVNTDGCTVISFYYDTGATTGQYDEGDTLIDTVTVCDGADGTNGTNGTNGTSPTVTFTSTPFDTSPDCPDGGTTVTIFIDDVQNISFDVCNGVVPQSYIVYSIIQDPTQCGDRGGVQVDVYDDVDGDGVLDPNIDFFLKSFTICMGMNAAQVLAIGYDLDDYVDLDITVEQGSDNCPSDPNGSYITVHIEGEFLIAFHLCNMNYKPNFTITNVDVTEIAQTSFRITTTTDVPVGLKIQYGTESRNYEHQTTYEPTLLTTHSQIVGGGNPINLTPNTTYYWRIYAEDENGIGGYSAERQTTTIQ